MEKKKNKRWTQTREKKKKRKKTVSQGTILSKMKETKSHIRLGCWGQFWRNRRKKKIRKKKKIRPMRRDNFIQKGSPTFSSYFGEITFWWAQRENTQASLFLSLTFSPKLSFSFNALFVLLKNLFVKIVFYIFQCLVT